MKIFMNILLGFCMALADSVPGVSGGTIAFIMGFYDEFISSLYHVVKGSKEEKKRGWLFLLRLILGWIVGFAAIVDKIQKWSRKGECLYHESCNFSRRLRHSDI